MKISDLKTYTVLGGTPTQPVSAPNAAAQKSGGFMDTVNNVASGVSNFVGAKGITEKLGAMGAKAMLPKDQRQYVEEPTNKEVIGSAIQTGAWLIPSAGIGANLTRKALVGAGTGYVMDVGSKLQQNKKIGDTLKPGVGTAVGGVLPVGGATIGFASRVLGRLFKGLGSGISGVSTNTLDQILNNPEVASKAAKKLAESGNDKIIEQNARQIINGISKIRQDARSAFGKGLEQLKKEDIDPKRFRTSVQAFLDKYGVSVSGKTRNLDVEFSDPKNLQRASNLIDELSKTDLDGFSLRKLLDKIEKTKFKTATSDERLSFNTFTKELAESVKGAISGSTGKLGEINKAFSEDMQLAEAAQNIFGKVNYKNLPEVVKASQKLEALFNQKGLAPKTIDDFLSKIGIKPSDFRAGEAVRQITNKEPMAPNAPGFNIGEIFRTATGSIITPETVRDITIKTGLAKEQVTPLLKSLQALSPALQKSVIQALLQNQ